MTRAERVEVVVVGGGTAGAATAALLAGLGHDVLLAERAPRWRWRACGVFAAPACVTALRRLGHSDADLARLATPVAAMRVETPRGVAFRLTYGGTGVLADSAVGFDREALETHLLDRARSAGARVHLGAHARRPELGPRSARLSIQGNEAAAAVTVDARVVVGADGRRSTVAMAAGATAKPPYPTRTALTFHVPWGIADDARMVIIEDGYVGLAPVPGSRLNVGIVLGPTWAPRVRAEGGAAVAAGILRSTLDAGRKGARECAAGPTPLPEPLDDVAGARPPSAAATRRAGPAWVLVGDAAGFLDPFTGEGLHRAIASAELAASTIHDVLAGRPGARLADYDAALRGRFRTKDVVSRVIQSFLARPALFEYAARRLAGRAPVRATMARVIGDLEPASRALDPRFLAALLAP